MHGLSSGLMSALDGGKFGAAFLSGFVSSAISSGIESLGQTGQTDLTVNQNGTLGLKAELNNFGKSGWYKASIIASGGLSGGISSRIAGGSFIAGFRQGLITSGLNHVASMVTDGISDDDNPHRKLLRSQKFKSTDEAHSLSRGGERWSSCNNTRECRKSSWKWNRNVCSYWIKNYN